jgi:RNA polymerase sigma factor (sigma-70 family)
MTLTPLQSVLRQLRSRLAGPESAAVTDGQLLRRFVQFREEAAFEALIRQHGPMVWGLCRRLLPEGHDAEDAFQATFLVLLQKADSIREHGSAASWLYGVAGRVARRARSNARRRRDVEGQAPAWPQPAAAAETAGREEVAIVEEELTLLPERLRAPLVLCGLEGLTKADAARQLGCNEGTLSSRLARGRQRLRERLARRGVAVPAAAVGGLLSEGAAPAAVPAALVAATVRTGAAFLAAGEVSGPLAALARGAAGRAAPAGLRVAAALLLGLVVAGAGLSARLARETDETPRQNEPAPGSRGPAPARADAFGDPLPPGAMARMGSARVHQLLPHAVFAADGKTLISAGGDYRINIWDAASGKLLHGRRMEGSEELDVSAIDLAPDGTAVLASHFSRPHLLLICDVPGGKKLGSVSLRSGRPFRAVVAPGGKTVAVAVAEDNTHAVRVWDVATGTERELLKHDRYDNAIAFSSDGKLLGAASTADSRLRVWDVATGKLLHALRVESECFAFSPDGKTVAAACYDRKVHLWDLAAGKETAALPLYSARCMAFSPDGKLLVAGSQDGLVLWDPGARKELYRLPGVWARSLAFAPDGKTLAVSEYARIQLRDVATGKPLLGQTGHGFGVDALAVSPDGKVVASASHGYGLCLWNADSGKLLHQLPGYTTSCRNVCFSRDGKLLASGGDGVLHLWETATGKERYRLPVEELQPEQTRGFIDALALSADGKRLAALSRWTAGPADHLQINFWDTASGKLLHRRRFDCSTFLLSCLCLTPDAGGITVPAANGLAVRDTVTDKELVTIPGTGNGVTGITPMSVVFSPDGKLLAVRLQRPPAPAVAGKRTKLVDVLVAERATGKEVLRIEAVEALVLAFSPDGSVLAVSDRAAVSLREIATGKELFRHEQHGELPGVPPAAAAQSLAFFPDGRRLAAGLWDGTILVWDVAPDVEAAKDLPSLWADLAGDDAPKVYRAVYDLASDAGVAYLKEHLQPVREVEPRHVQRLLADLDGEEFATRERAAKELTALGERVEPALRGAMKESPSAEVRNRAEELLAAIKGVASRETLRELRAVWALERAGTPAARQLLGELAKGLPSARQTVRARAALERLNK